MTMIHLDHNHSSIPGPTNPQNLILSNSPRTDQHRVLPWPSPARDGRPFYQESQEHFLSDPSKPLPFPDKSSNLTSNLNPTDPSSSTLSSTGSSLVTSADAHLHPLPEPSPSSPTDARSPPADSTSSLTPPPDAASPTAAMDAPDDPPGQQPATTNTNGGAGSMEKTGEQQAAADDLDRASRQSTPLSELSSAPETAPDDEQGPGDDPANIADGESASVPGGEAAKGRPDGGATTSSSHPQKGSSSASAASLSAKESASSSFQQNLSVSSLNQTTLHPNVDGTTGRSHYRAGADGTPAPKMAPGQLSLLDGTPSGHPLQPSLPHSKALSHDPKVVSILELNSLLLRVSMEFQARGVSMTDPSFHQYSLRLQSNLTWLAAAADDNHKVSQSMLALPVMTPPPPVEFVEMERILQLYRGLPTIFAKELARRQQAQGGLINGNAKRERTEEPVQDSIHKRRDTGETKAHIPISIASPGAGPSTPHPPPQPMQQAPNAAANMSMSAGPVARIGSPSMPPPPVPPGAMGANEAQVAAARARQAQIRAMQQQHEGVRQMSPPSGMPSGIAMSNAHNVAGPSSMPNMPQLTQQQMAALSSMGPQAVQNYQALQTPNHPFVQYLTQQMPGFMQLPLQEKLQKMQIMQNALRQQQQQQRNAAQAQAVGQMGNFSQGGMQGGMLPQHTGDSSPSRMSPVSQQSPMQPSLPQSSNPAVDPRSMMSAQQQQALASMNPQQRQLFLMQQQMMRGGGGTSGGMNPQMMNQQQVMQERMRLEQQRMAHAQAQAAAASGQAPSPNAMGSPMVDGPQFPALRSNPGMPGIARSTRTPSDSNPSPVSSQQRMSMSAQSPEEQQRAMMMMQQQAQQRGMAPQMQGASYGNGMSNQAYAAQMQQIAMSGIRGQNPNAFRMTSPPGSAGGGGPGAGGFGGGGAPSPVAPAQMWGQSPGGGQGFQGGGGGPYMAPSPSASQHEGMTPGRQTSATPAPHQQMAQGALADQDLDFFNWAT